MLNKLRTLLKATDITRAERALLTFALTLWAIPMPWVFGMDDVGAGAIVGVVVVKVNLRRARVR